jgi:2-polyprenyl-3-methyl-5-hydroxy-6-metoxy-1,4-benzoquinol methylase
LGQNYEVFNCKNCDTSFVQPLTVDPTLYDAIYAQSDQIPGYDRYVRYAKAVAGLEEPLAYLARSEDVYWSIMVCVQKLRPGARILEIGSGLGYLTYALRQSGYDATGMDLSPVAVAEAIARFGPHYLKADLADWSVRQAGAFDLVIMAELIEHVPDPAGFLAMAAKLLRPGGSLVFTTPNKSHFPAAMLWETEAPPIHLWWFSEASMKVLAKELGLGLAFVDFAPFNREHPPLRPPIFNPEQPTRGAMLAADSRALAPAELRRQLRARRPRWYGFRRWLRSMACGLAWLRGRSVHRPTASQRGTLCAVMTKPGPG